MSLVQSQLKSNTVVINKNTITVLFILVDEKFVSSWLQVYFDQTRNGHIRQDTPRKAWFKRLTSETNTTRGHYNKGFNYTTVNKGEYK